MSDSESEEPPVRLEEKVEEAGGTLANLHKAFGHHLRQEESGESESEEEAWATAAVSEGAPRFRSSVACPRSPRSHYARTREDQVSGEGGGEVSSLGNLLDVPHDRMVSGDKDEPADAYLVDTLCESAEQGESEEEDGNGVDGKPAYSRRGCPPCSPADGRRREFVKTGLVGIYMLSFPNGMRYVGQSVDIVQRWKHEHHEALRGNVPTVLYRAIRKHGWHNVRKEILLLCPEFALDHWEQQMIDAWGTWVREGHGYNVTRGGQFKLGRFGRHDGQRQTWDAKRKLHGDAWEQERVDALRQKYEEKGWDEERIATKMENARRAKETRMAKYAGTHADGRFRTSERRAATWLARQEAHAATLSPVSRERYWRKLGNRKRAKANFRAKRKAERTGNFDANS